MPMPMPMSMPKPEMATEAKLRSEAGIGICPRCAISNCSSSRRGEAATGAMRGGAEGRMRRTNVQTCAGTVSDIQLVCLLAIAFVVAVAVATPTKQLARGKETGGEGDSWSQRVWFGLTLANGYATFCLCSADAPSCGTWQAARQMAASARLATA